MSHQLVTGNEYVGAKDLIMTNISILVPGQDGGSYEMLAKLIHSVLPDSSIKYMDNYETAFTYMQKNPCICIYSEWEYDNSLKNGAASGGLGFDPWGRVNKSKDFVGWMYQSFDSFMSSNDSTLEDLTVYNPDRTPLRFGVYEHPQRIKLLEETLAALGILKYKIVPYGSFVEMRRAVKSSRDIDFLYGNSVNLYRRAGAKEILTTRDQVKFWLPESGVPEMKDYVSDPGVAVSSSLVGLICENVDKAEILSEMFMNHNPWNDDDILDRGYVRTDFTDMMVHMRRNDPLPEDQRG